MFVFTSSCSLEDSCLIYVICVCLYIVVSNTYCVVLLLCYLYPMLPAALRCQLLLSLRYSLTFSHQCQLIEQLDTGKHVVPLGHYLDTNMSEQELLTLPEHLSSPPVFRGVRVTRSFVLCVCFVDRCFLFFCTFSFGHCVVCSSIYGF